MVCARTDRGTGPLGAVLLDRAPRDVPTGRHRDVGATVGAMGQHRRIDHLLDGGRARLPDDTISPGRAALRAADDWLGIWRPWPRLSGRRRRRRPNYRPPRRASRATGGIAGSGRPHRTTHPARHRAGLAVAAYPGALYRFFGSYHRRCRRHRDRHLRRRGCRCRARHRPRDDEPTGRGHRRYSSPRCRDGHAGRPPGRHPLCPRRRCSPDTGGRGDDLGRPQTYRG